MILNWYIIHELTCPYSLIHHYLASTLAGTAEDISIHLAISFVLWYRDPLRKDFLKFIPQGVKRCNVKLLYILSLLDYFLSLT